MKYQHLPALHQQHLDIGLLTSQLDDCISMRDGSFQWQPRSELCILARGGLTERYVVIQYQMVRGASKTLQSHTMTRNAFAVM